MIRSAILRRTPTGRHPGVLVTFPAATLLYDFVSLFRQLVGPSIITTTCGPAPRPHTHATPVTPAAGPDAHAFRHD